jgi:hypothetical protein
MEDDLPNMEVCAIKVKSPEKKKRKKSDTKEAVRKRRKALYENEDFKVQGTPRGGTGEGQRWW